MQSSKSKRRHIHRTNHPVSLTTMHTKEAGLFFRLKETSHQPDVMFGPRLDPSSSKSSEKKTGLRHLRKSEYAWVLDDTKKSVFILLDVIIVL